MSERTDESLLRYGYSKDKRPDLLQYRQLLATLDPMGMPLVSATLEGNGADDPLYFPTWQKIVKVIGCKDFVFVADCKAGAIATRAQIAANGGIYCVPVPMTGQHSQYLKQWVLDPPSESVDIRLPRQEEEEVAVGRGFEVELGKFWLNPETNKWVRWHERYLVVYSHSLALSAIRGQQQRINQAKTALDRLTTKPGDDQELLNYKIKNILKRYRVNDFFLTTINEETQTETRHVGRGRPSKNSPTQVVTKAFSNLTLYFLPDSTIFVTPLSDLQKLILSLMKMSESLYQPNSKLCKT